MKPRCPACAGRLPDFPSPWTATSSNGAVETCSETCCSQIAATARQATDAALHTQMNAERDARNARRRAS